MLTCSYGKGRIGRNFWSRGGDSRFDSCRDLRRYERARRRDVSPCAGSHTYTRPACGTRCSNPHQALARLPARHLGCGRRPSRCRLLRCRDTLRSHPFTFGVPLAFPILSERYTHVNPSSVYPWLPEIGDGTIRYQTSCSHYRIESVPSNCRYQFLHTGNSQEPKCHHISQIRSISVARSSP